MRGCTASSAADELSNDTTNALLNRVQVVPISSQIGRLYPAEASISLNGERGKPWRTQPYRYVAHELQRLGSWTGAAARFDIPPASDSHDRTAILARQVHSGPTLTAVRG